MLILYLINNDFMFNLFYKIVNIYVYMLHAIHEYFSFINKMLIYKLIVLFIIYFLIFNIYFNNFAKINKNVYVKDLLIKHYFIKSCFNNSLISIIHL